MRYATKFFLAVVALLGLAASVFAQTYPTLTPFYIPTASGPTCTTSGTGAQTCVMSTQGLGTVSIRLSGTNGGFSAAIKGSNDFGANFTTLNAFPVGGGSSVSSQSANGFWLVNAGGLNQVEVAFASVASGAVTVSMAGTPASMNVFNAGSVASPVSVVDQTDTYYQATFDAAARAGYVKNTDGTNVGAVKAASTVPATTDPALVVTQSPNGDPCQSPAVQKSTVALNQSSSATTKVVDTSASTVVYVCSFTASLAGTTPTVTFITGTHGSADCDTSAANLSGAMTPSATVGVLHDGGNGTIMKSIAGGQLCMTTAATTSVQGILSYVQR